MRYKITGALLAAAILQQPVAAQSVAHASVSDFHFSLRDLDTTDGIAPALLLTGQDQLASQLHAYVYGGSAAAQQDRTGRSEFPFEPVSLGLHGQDSSVALSVSGGDLFSAVLYSALSTAGDGASWNRAFGNASVDNIAFRLTPHTELLLSANADLWAATPTTGAARAGEGVSAVGMLALSFHGSSGWSSTYAYQNVHAETLWDTDSNTYRFTGMNMANQQAISLRFANAGASYGDGILSLSAGTSGNGWTAIQAPVPEPSGVSLMLAGLGLLGLCAGRRDHDNRICPQEMED